MSTNKIQLLDSDKTQLLTSDIESQVKSMAVKLMKLTSNGKNLATGQAAELAVYSLMMQLNPFNGECYYIDKVGPIPGIAGYRVKATQWLQLTSGRQEGIEIYETYRPATKDEADFDPNKGDIAWVATLHSSLANEQWEGRLIKLARTYKEMGAEFKEAHAQALIDIGPKPCWEGVGVVYHTEHFSGVEWVNGKATNEYKPEKWDRNERAKKRAAKGAYRKGFPQMNLPDPEYGEVVDALAEDVKENIIRDMQREDLAPRLSASKQVDILMGEAPRLSVEERIRERARSIDGVADDYRGPLVGLLEQIVGEERHALGQFLYGKQSSKKWKDGEVLALWEYLKVHQDPETKEFIPDRIAANTVKIMAREGSGQISLPGVEV